MRRAEADSTRREHALTTQAQAGSGRLTLMLAVRSLYLARRRIPQYCTPLPRLSLARTMSTKTIAVLDESELKDGQMHASRLQ